MSSNIVVLHRWQGTQARYAEYVDHRDHRVAYITTPLARDSVPIEARAVQVVPTTESGYDVRRALIALLGELGHCDHLVALNEGDLDLAAQLREEFGIAGADRRTTATVRDKVVMNGRARELGLRVPDFAPVSERKDVVAFARERGMPIVVKPRRGTASRGVLVAERESDLPAAEDWPVEPMLAQSFQHGDIYHLDGVWLGDRLGPWRMSYYVNRCMDFLGGSVLGSVEEDDPAVLALGEEMLATMAAGFGHGRPWVFHLEVFRDRTSAYTGLTFLEVGARVGGAEIPFVWREIHGHDLMATAFDFEVGRTPATCQLALDGGRDEDVAGWLLVPTPIPKPCVVVATELVDRDPLTMPYAQVVPAPGTVVPAIGGYEHVGARFRFSGHSSCEVEHKIRHVAENFRMECAPLARTALLPGPPASAHDIA